MSNPASAKPGRTFERIPVVDVSGLIGDDPAARCRVADELGAAARDCGFLYVTGHGISAALRARLVERAKDFFALPADEKMKSWIGRSGIRHRGYVPEGEEVFGAGPPDRKEAFDLGFDLPVDDPLVAAGTPMAGPNVWPELPGFAADVSAYYAAALDLGRRLAEGFAIALGQPEDAFTRFVTKPLSQLRLIHYPYDANAPDDRPGIGAHTDYEIFTILMPTGPGLEVMNDAGVWIDAPPVPDAFVVNIGDMLESWTNGTFVATSHRVRKVGQERYSFPLFFGADWDAPVAPLPAFTGPDRPPAYPAFTAGEHLWAATVGTFRYLKEMRARGEIVLPESADAPSPFGREVKQTKAGAA